MTSPARTYRPQHLARQVQLAGAPLASFRRRAVAFVLDAGVLALLVLAVVLPLPGAVRFPASDEMRVSIQLSSVAVAVGGVLYFGVATWIGRGRTPGKRLLGIRVVSLVHERLSLWHCIERALGYFASSLEGGFGFFQYFTHINAQTVHDRIAETIVVREIRRADTSPGTGVALPR